VVVTVTFNKLTKLRVDQYALATRWVMTRLTSHLVAGFDLTLSTEWVDEGCEETSELSDLHDQVSRYFTYWL